NIKAEIVVKVWRKGAKEIAQTITCPQVPPSENMLLAFRLKRRVIAADADLINGYNLVEHTDLSHYIAVVMGPAGLQRSKICVGIEVNDPEPLSQPADDRIGDRMIATDKDRKRTPGGEDCRQSGDF